MTNLLPTNRFSLIDAVKRKMTALIMVAIVLFSGACFAIPPVTITGPSPAIPGHIPSGTTNTYTFTITNNVPLAFPLSISPVQAPITRTTVANDCGNTVPAGSSCNIGFTIAPGISDEGRSVLQPLVINYQGRTNITQLIEFIVPSNPVLTAVGSASIPNSNDTMGYIASNSDGNPGSWVNTLETSNAISEFRASACTGSGANTLCVAVGRGNSTVGAIQVSHDAGQTWTPISTPSNKGTPDFISVSCMGSSATGLCVAVGALDIGLNSTPIVYTSQDGGVTWNEKTIPAPPSTLSPIDFLTSVSCTGTESTPFCVAVGQSSFNKGLTYVSYDGGNTWNVVTSIGQPLLVSVSCIGHNTGPLCLAGGIGGLYGTTDGVNWTKLTGAAAPTPQEQIVSVSCTGTSTNNFCVAAGFGGSLISVTNGIFSGATKYIAPNVQNFNSASCTGSGASTVCIAAGVDQVPYPQVGGSILYVSNDLGAHWTSPGNTSIQLGNFYGSSCTGLGASAICIAVGSGGADGNTPLLVQSNDGGTSWQPVTVTGAPVNGSSFIASGATE